MPNNISTFLIGFFASICAVFVPRMVTMLNSSNGGLQYFHRDYVLVGLAFALLIGVITVIFEQGKNKKASETFMTALGIPALLAGALNSGVAGNDVTELQTANQKLNEALAQKSGISIEEKTSTIVPLEAAPANPRPPVSQSSFSFITVAQAREDEYAPAKSTSLNLSTQADQPRYLIVLEKFKTKAEAIQRAEGLRKALPRAAAVQSDRNFLVIDSEEPLKKSDALLKAIELQNKTGLKPYLLQVK